MIACGTSVGVGTMSKPENTVEISIDGIGTLSNTLTQDGVGRDPARIAKAHAKCIAGGGGRSVGATCCGTCIVRPLRCWPRRTTLPSGR